MRRLTSSRIALRLSSSPFARKITRYALGSVVALGDERRRVRRAVRRSGPDTTACSIAAFFAGAIPNWVLNRRWAWEVTGKVEVAREVIGYAIVSLLAVAASSLATGWTNAEVQSLPAHTASACCS